MPAKSLCVRRHAGALYWYQNGMSRSMPVFANGPFRAIFVKGSFPGRNPGVIHSRLVSFGCERHMGFGVNLPVLE